MNPTPKGRIRRSSKQKVENSNFEEHLTPVATMTDNRTMAEMLRAPTEGLRLLRKSVLPEKVLIHTTSVLPSVATLSKNSGITSKGSLPGNTVAKPKGELKAITTRSGLVTDGPIVLTPPKSVTLEEDECVEETYTDQDLAKYTIKSFLILGRPFLRTARALIDVHGEEMILRDGDERLTLNMKHDTASTTYLSNSLLKEFTNELALITYPLDYDDNLKCDIKSDLREIEFLLYQDVPNSMRLLPFSSENEEKVFKPGIYTSEKVHSCFLLELSHPGYHVFKVNQIFISLMKIFHVQSGKNSPPLDVLLFHFYPP
nr:hypothetical protein [Tanacetum cinerariifolium]